MELADTSSFDRQSVFFVLLNKGCIVDELSSFAPAAEAFACVMFSQDFTSDDISSHWHATFVTFNRPLPDDTSGRSTMTSFDMTFVEDELHSGLAPVRATAALLAALAPDCLFDGLTGNPEIWDNGPSPIAFAVRLGDPALC